MPPHSCVSDGIEKAWGRWKVSLCTTHKEAMFTHTGACATGIMESQNWTAKDFMAHISWEEE